MPCIVHVPLQLASLRATLVITNLSEEQARDLARDSLGFVTNACLSHLGVRLASSGICSACHRELDEESVFADSM